MMDPVQEYYQRYPSLVLVAQRLQEHIYSCLEGVEHIDRAAARAKAQSDSQRRRVALKANGRSRANH